MSGKVAEPSGNTTSVPIAGENQSGDIQNLEVDSDGNLLVSTSSVDGTTATRTTLTPSLTSQTLIAANTGRLGLKLIITCVDPSQNIWVKCGGSASSTNFMTQRQGSGEIILYDSCEFPYTGLYSVISDVASGTIQVIELTA